MAKSSAKSAVSKTKGAAAKTARPKAAQGNIEKATVDALSKLRSLNIQPELQNDLEWCLGSYRSDGNPVGLYSMVERAIAVFKEELAKKTKGVTAKLISDLEKVVKNR